MAEEKIIKHTGDAARALLKKNADWKKKISEFFLEIFIIVIAVSITLWFHNWNDHLHERQLEDKKFMDDGTGVRPDDLRGAAEPVYHVYRFEDAYRA